MPRVRNYKKAEKQFSMAFTRKVKSTSSGVGKFFSFLAKNLSKKLTIMVVPHSQKKVLNFQTSVFSVLLVGIFAVGMVVFFVWFGHKNAASNVELARLTKENIDTRASFDELRSESTNLLNSAKKFKESLSETLSVVGLEKPTTQNQNLQNGDLSALFGAQEIAQGSSREVAELKMLTAYLDSAIEPVEQIGKLLETQGSLFSDIPSIWPLKGGIGHISFPYGRAIHPITGQWYIHKGMDFSTYRSGDPIVSTAAGQVVTIGYDSGFGKYVIVKHKHGFYTRYAHMSATYVHKGQFVSQGDIIGAIGNTGISTGPHLHYEIHIGSEIVDPAKYLNLVATKSDR